jgi:hypothetical protein
MKFEKGKAAKKILCTSSRDQISIFNASSDEQQPLIFYMVRYSNKIIQSFKL